MKPHPRIRKTVKWGGTALTVLLVALWILCAWYNLGYIDSVGRGAVLADGRIILLHNREVKFLGSGLTGWTASLSEEYPRINWWFDFSFEEPITGGAIPLWLPTGFTLLATAAAWRAEGIVRRRTRGSLCGTCGYDRAGLAKGSPCPECGGGKDGLGSK